MLMPMLQPSAACDSELMCMCAHRKQDNALDEIEQHVNRIGRMGRAIGEELEGQVSRGRQRLCACLCVWKGGGGRLE